MHRGTPHRPRRTSALPLHPKTHPQNRAPRLSPKLLPWTIAAVAFLSFSHLAQGQAEATAERDSRISFFGGVDGTDSGLRHGKNLGVTAGMDYGFRRIFGLTPSAEIRGTYPIDSGGVVGIKDILGGVQLKWKTRHVSPYIDVLGGEGEQSYSHEMRNITRTWHYTQSFSGVYAGGIGADIPITEHLAFKIDAQAEHFDSPMTTSRTEWVKAGTLGIKYTLPFRNNRYGPRG